MNMNENHTFINVNLGLSYSEPLYIRFNTIVEVDFSHKKVLLYNGSWISPSTKAMKIIVDYVKAHEITDKNTTI